MRAQRLVSPFAFLLLAVLQALAAAAVPQAINYQGYLADSGGSPVITAVDLRPLAITRSSYYWTAMTSRYQDMPGSYLSTMV